MKFVILAGLMGVASVQAAQPKLICGTVDDLFPNRRLVVEGKLAGGNLLKEVYVNMIVPDDVLNVAYVGSTRLSTVRKNGVVVGYNLNVEQYTLGLPANWTYADQPFSGTLTYLGDGRSGRTECSVTGR